MRFEIRRRGVKATEELRVHIKERLRLALGRFARHIGLVRVYLRDVNGTRGGLGKKCRIVVELPPRGRVVVAGADTGISAAITGTATRAGFAVKRHVKRRRENRRAPRCAAGRVPLMIDETEAGVPSTNLLPEQSQDPQAREKRAAEENTMSTISLCIRPEAIPFEWEDFCATHGPYTIGLDGYVAAGSRFDPSGPRLNLDHHTEVDRLAARATCAQTLLTIRQGLFECFRDEQGPRAEVCVNHCDEDICTSWFLLTHADLTAPGKHAPLERFVNLVDVLDTTAGAYPLPADLSPLKELAWVFSPYHCFRRSGELDRQQPEGHRGVVDEVLSRIERHLSGRGGSYPLDGRYERRGGGPGWVLIREVGAQARLAVTADGIRAYVTVRERPDGRWAYVVGRASPFVSFDVPAILHALNEAEGTTKDRWGGSNLVGGSPRVQGSRLSPSEVERVINGFVGRTDARTKPRSPSIRDGRGRADSLAMPGAVASL